MTRFLSACVATLVLAHAPLFSQQVTTASPHANCGTMQRHQELLAQNPGMAAQIAAIEAHTQQMIGGGTHHGGPPVIIIPVVVHVVYNTPSQNIPTAQIQSQIDVLNEDFRRLNADAVNTPQMFLSVAADTQLEFCLATEDPQGNPHTGITRTPTNVPTFSANDRVKSLYTGGQDPWPSTDYLNIWVCNLGGGVLGYSQFPGGPASTDGIVVDYQHFGRGPSPGILVPPFDLGRTATHEVGHWLNLSHIWGAGGCTTDDLVLDTPMASGPNVGCGMGHASCGTVDMVQNYMDYTNDACKNLFTQGQKDRMRALFGPGGARESILSSSGCGAIGPQWQTNSPLASIDFDGVASNSYSAAISTRCGGQHGTFTMTSSEQGGLFNLGFMPSALTPGNSPLSYGTPGGQLIHINLYHPYTRYWNNSGPVPIPYPGDQVIPYTAPPTGSFSAQMLKVHPSHPDGFYLSAGAQLHVDLNPPAPMTYTLALGDDDTIAISPSAPVTYYGSSAGTIYVNSNGSVSLNTGDTGFQANTNDFISGPPRVAGHWSDLAPNTGGTIEWSENCGDTSVRFIDVPEWPSGPETTTFHITFAGNGDVLIDNASSGAGWTTDSLVGFSPGNTTNGTAVTFSSLVGTSTTPSAGEAVYEFTQASGPSTFGTLLLTANGQLIVN